MSGGYIAVTVVFFVLALLASLLAYRYYTRVSIKTIPIWCAIWHVISLYMCVLPFPLLVVDIEAASHNTPQEWMRGIWIAIFAVTYFCAWISLPLAQMYTEAGSFTWKRALLYSTKINLKLYAIIIVVVLVFFVYLLILKGAWHTVGSILKIGISLANAWGLLILTLFMPAGLVGLPRSMYRSADARRMMRRYLYNAVDIQEDLDLAAMDLAQIKAELLGLDPSVNDEYRPYLGQMLELISDADRDIPLYHVAAMRVRVTAPDNRTDVSLEHLEELHMRLKKAIKVVTRANYRWNSTIRHCNSLDEILQGTKVTNNRIKKIWFPIRQYVYYGLCVVFSFLTVTILWSELVLPFRSLTSFPLGLVEVMMNSSVQFVCSIVMLFYMACCSYWAAFQFKVFDVYVVYPSIADNASLCFNETFLVRLLMPLCYNFLLISGLSQKSEVDVQYGHVYRRNMDITLLFGSWVNTFLPMLIPFIALIVLFKLTDRVLSLVGVEIHNPNNVDTPAVRQRIVDGRKLVENELGYSLVTSVMAGDETVTVSAVVDPSGGKKSAPAEGSAIAGSRYREYLEQRQRKQEEAGTEGQA